MNRARNFAEFLGMVGEADQALRVISEEAGKQLAQAISNAGIATESLVEVTSGTGVMISSSDPEVLELCEAAAGGVKGVSIQPRVRLEDVLALHGQGKIESLRARDGKDVEAVVLRDDKQRRVRAEFLIDSGFRTEFRTIVVICGVGVEEEAGRAVPVTYWCNRYSWEGTQLLCVSKEFPRECDGGAKKGVAEWKVCDGGGISEILAKVEEGEGEREEKRDALEEAISRFMGYLGFLTGLVLGEVKRCYPPRQSQPRPQRDRGFSMADFLGRPTLLGTGNDA